MRATVIRRLKSYLGLAQKRQVMGFVKACVRALGLFKSHGAAARLSGKKVNQRVYPTNADSATNVLDLLV